MPWNSVEKVILERRSIRAFKKEPLPDSMICRILEAGRYAPSAGNSQPWKFIVVNSQEIIAEMEKDTQKMIKLFMFLLDYTRGNILRRLYILSWVKWVIRFMKNKLHPVPFGLMSQIAQDKTPVFHGAPDFGTAGGRPARCRLSAHGYRYLRSEYGSGRPQHGSRKLLDRSYPGTDVSTQMEKKIRHQVSVSAQRLHSLRLAQP